MDGFQLPEYGSVPNAGPDPLQDLWQTTISQATGQMAAPADDPFVRLKRHIAEGKKRWQDRLKSADDAALPIVIDDYKQSVQRADAIQARIDMALTSLNAPPPAFQQPQLNQGEQLTAGIAALLAPEGMNQVLQALQAGAQSRSDVEFDNALRAYGLSRETAKLGLQQLMSQLDREQSVQDRIQGQQFAIDRDTVNYNRGREQFFDEAEFDVAKMELQDYLRRQADTREYERDTGLAILKAEADKWAANQKSLEDAVNDLRSEIQGTLNSLGEINDDDRAVFTARRQALKDAGVPEAKLPHIPTGKTRLQVQYEEGATLRNINESNARLRGEIMGIQKTNLLNKPSPEVAAKGKSFKAAQDAADKAIRATNTAWANLPPEPQSALDLNAMAQYQLGMAKFGEVVRKEYEAVMQKRQAADPNASIPSFESYFRSVVARYKPRAVTEAPAAGPAKVTVGDKTSSLYNAARAEGLALIKKHPDKAAAIRKRFQDTYGVPLK